MELITYPFSLFVGGVFVLFLTTPFFFWGYKGVQEYIKFLTRGRYELDTIVDEKLYGGWSSLREPYCFILFASTALCLITLFLCGLETSVHNGTFLENLIFFSFSLPVNVVAKVSPVLFPVFVLFMASFGMRKLVSIGYEVNERLHKVENK